MTRALHCSDVDSGEMSIVARLLVKVKACLFKYGVAHARSVALARGNVDKRIILRDDMYI